MNDITEEDIKKAIILQNVKIKTLTERINALEEEIDKIPDLEELSEQIAEYKQIKNLLDKTKDEMVDDVSATILHSLSKWMVELDVKTIFKPILVVIGFMILVFFIFFLASTFIREFILFNRNTYFILFKN